MMLQGDTVRLVVTFKDFDMNVVQAEDIVLTIYDVDKNVIETITDIKQKGESYYYDYVAQQPFIFEFKGTYNDKTLLVRQQVQVNFVN